MTFLTPLPAIVAAAIAVPVLLGLYLLKLRRRPVRVSSTMFWADRPRDLQVNVPLRWLRPSWLLFLQLLILALFLLALGRPALDLDTAPPERIVLVIDRTASMSATDAGGASRLERAKERAASILDGLLRSGGSEACIIEAGYEARAATPFLRDRGSLKAAVRAIEPSDQPGGVAGALRLAAALLAPDEGATEEGPRAPPGLIVLMSDGALPKEDLPSLGGAAFRFERIGPRGEDAEKRDNLGIVGIAVRRDYEDPGAVRVFARLQNAGRAAVPIPLELSLDDEAVERRAVTVPGAGAEGPGQLGVTMEVRTTGGGLLTLRIARDDQLASDDAASVVLAPAARPRILLVIPDAAPGSSVPPGEGPEWLLADPLRELRARSLRIIPASSYEQTAASESGLGADLVIFDRVTPARLPGVPTVSFGAGLPLAGVRLDEGYRGGTHALSWDRSSPVLRNVSLDEVFIAHPMRVRPESGDESTTIVELARGREGPLILHVQEGSIRRLVVAFELSQSTWPLSFGFAIFLADSVDYLTLRGEDQVAGGGATFTTAEPAEIAVSAAAREAALRGPIDIPLQLSDAPSAGTRRVAVGVLPRAGVYRTEGDGEPRPVAANLVSEHESAIATRDVVITGGEAAGTGDLDSGPREIWHWFVTAALVLLAVEWFLHAWLMRA